MASGIATGPGPCGANRSRPLPRMAVRRPQSPHMGQTRMRVVQIYRVAALLLIVGLLAGLGSPLLAQAPNADTGNDREPKRVAIRFRTNNDFSPFNYLDEDNVLTGFNVDVARAVCLELNAACDIQVRPWDQLLPALVKGEADAVIASHVVSPNALKVVDFTDRYYFTPARFAGKRGGNRLDMTPESLEGKRIAVAKAT